MSHIIVSIKKNKSFFSELLNHNQIFTFANVFPYMTLPTKLTFNFAMNTFHHVILFFSLRMDTISSLQYI